MRSLFDVNEHIAEVLTMSDMQHGVDFKMMKKVKREDGQEWAGMLPQEDLTPDQALGAYHQRGFSLLINAMQNRWGPVARLGRFLETEIMP